MADRRHIIIGSQYMPYLQQVMLVNGVRALAINSGLVMLIQMEGIPFVLGSDLPGGDTCIHIDTSHVFQGQMVKNNRALECPICSDVFGEKDPITRLACSHMYHTGCITRWCRTKTSCPLCRAPIRATLSDDATF